MTRPPAPTDPLDVAVAAFSSRLRLDILSALAHSPGSTAQQLATELGVIRSTLGVNLRALEAADELEPYTLYQTKRQAMVDMVARHEAYGIFLLSAIFGNPAIRTIQTLPENSYKPIRYHAVIIASDRMAEARKFLVFLQTPEAVKLLNRRGFLTN